MKIHPSINAYNDTSLHKKGANQEALQKTPEKVTKPKQQQHTGAPQTVNKAGGGKQGRIDLYA